MSPSPKEDLVTSPETVDDSVPPPVSPSSSGSLSSSAKVTTDTPSSGVRFESHCEMILVPSREEIHQAGVGSSLWWGKMDFFCFQRKACSEIRLLALLQGISMTEARHRLYQPEADPDAEAWNYVLTESTPPPSAPTSPEPVSHRKHIQSKNGKHVPAPASHPSPSSSSSSSQHRPQASSSLDIESTSFSAALSQEVPFSPTPHQDRRTRSMSWEETLSSLSSSLTAAASYSSASAETEQYADLHFCVPLTERVPLSVRESTLGRGGAKAKGRGKGGAQGQSLCATLFLGACGLVLPLVGFYLVSGHSLLSPQHFL